MGKYDEILQSSVNMDYNELLATAKIATGILIEDFRKHDPVHDGKIIFFHIVLSTIAMDKQFTPLERKFICELLKMNNEEIDHLISFYNPRMVISAKNFIDTLDTTKRNAVFIIVAAIASCDKTVKREENACINIFFD